MLLKSIKSLYVLCAAYSTVAIGHRKMQSNQSSKCVLGLDGWQENGLWIRIGVCYAAVSSHAQNKTLIRAHSAITRRSEVCLWGKR